MDGDAALPLRGEAVVLHLSQDLGPDPFGAPVFGEADLAVGDVLVSPLPARDATGTNRPLGARAAYALHLPKAAVAALPCSLEGQHATVRGERMRVIGAPRAYAPALTPGKWNMEVEVEAVDG